MFFSISSSAVCPAARAAARSPPAARAPMRMNASVRTTDSNPAERADCINVRSVTRVEDLPTPAVLVDLDVLERNVARMQGLAHAAGVALRPHGKTHKSPEVGRMQLSAGARGLTLAKTSEAEVFADLGFDDIFLAYPIVGADKARRLLALADRVRLTVGADSVAGVRSLGDVFAAAGRRLRVLLKVDTGFHRVGVAPERAAALAVQIASLPGIELAGVFTHAGQ